MFQLAIILVLNKQIRIFNTYIHIHSLFQSGRGVHNCHMGPETSSIVSACKISEYRGVVILEYGVLIPNSYGSRGQVK